ncbi:hypothetical protein TPA0905_22210 [Streptomyces olivaceus]|nr:hypothetical protein TPA0905_22210 [Streptomyces olivaceus]
MRNILDPFSLPGDLTMVSAPPALRHVSRATPGPLARPDPEAGAGRRSPLLLPFFPLPRDGLVTSADFGGSFKAF